MSVRAALLDVLRAVVPTYDGDAKGATDQRYAVLYPSPGRRSAEDVAGTYDLLEYRFTVVSVSLGASASPQQAEWVAGRTSDALIGTVLTVPGLSCGPIEQYEPTPITRDDDLPETTFYTSSQYVLHASRN